MRKQGLLRGSRTNPLRRVYVKPKFKAMTTTYKKKLMAKGKRIAKMFDCKFTEEPPKNGFGGYENGTTTVWLNVGKLYIVATCGNCGDGTWIEVP